MANYGDPKCIGCPYRNADHLTKTEFTKSHPQPLSMERALIPLGVMIVGQAPGENEWRECRPLLAIKKRRGATAGRRVELSWNRVNEQDICNLCRENYDITNAVQCFPGKQPLTAKNNKPRDMPPCGDAQAKCREWLMQDVLTANPRLIICFGDIARMQIEAVLRARLASGHLFEEPQVVCLAHPSSGRLYNEDLDAAWRR